LFRHGQPNDKEDQQTRYSTLVALVLRPLLPIPLCRSRTRRGGCLLAFDPPCEGSQGQLSFEEIHRHGRAGLTDPPQKIVPQIIRHAIARGGRSRRVRRVPFPVPQRRRKGAYAGSAPRHSEESCARCASDEGACRPAPHDEHWWGETGGGTAMEPTVRRGYCCCRFGGGGRAERRMRALVGRRSPPPPAAAAPAHVHDVRRLGLPTSSSSSPPPPSSFRLRGVSQFRPNVCGCSIDCSIVARGQRRRCGFAKNPRRGGRRPAPLRNRSSRSIGKGGRVGERGRRK
jgi:hypothetical protein